MVPPRKLNTVEAIERAVMDSYEANCPLKPKCQKKGDVWFNKDLNDQKKKVRTLKWKQRRNCAFREEYLNSLTSFKNKVRKARLSSWRDFCGGVEGFPGTARLLRVLSNGGTWASGWIKGPDGSPRLLHRSPSSSTA